MAKMAKYAFNNDAQNLSDALGIDKEKFNNLSEAVKQTVVVAIFLDKSITNTGIALERLINSAQPVGEVEAMALGFMFGRASVKAEQLASRIAEVIGI